MIKIENLKKSNLETKVIASDNLFKELGNNTYDFKDLLSELIDNSIAARNYDNQLNVEIILYIDENKTGRKLIVRDNAKGIPQDILGNAISPACIQSENSLNEHGMGMKQAIAAIGKLEYLATKTFDEDEARVILKFGFGEIETYYSSDIDFKYGTEISITDLHALVRKNMNSQSISLHLEPYLGARYRKFLKNDNKLLNLSISLVDITNSEVKNIWNISEKKPIYFHPGTRTNQPVISNYLIEGNDWKAELVFGYAPKDSDEYQELGIEPINKFHPYYVSLNRQGLDILLHNRVILFHQLSSIGIVNIPHNDYNIIRGEINLISGFYTAITKNSIISNTNFLECIDKVKNILRGEIAGPSGKKNDYLQLKSYPEELPEKLLRDRLAHWLINNKHSPKKNVSKEYVIEGIEGYIDIYADSEAWEIKTHPIRSYDVYQLFMYMDVAEINTGYLVGKEFSEGAKVAVKHIKDKHKKEIKDCLLSEFPINHPPSDEERKDYY